VITNREEGKGKPPQLFPKTGYPLGYPEPALQQKTEEREERDLNTTLLQHLFIGLFSRTTWLSWHQKDKLFWILIKREMMGWQ